ncbi:MAG: Unknown protein [uncultured Thiotrichaceae bacterium]|uniref:Uncharacterized protein n=1 Tax=uncultured Thiotrichaceae bacterium TaxID=298394 RepID=A0A6S6TYA6_9GAMM|nr:MAG: Unknown protein [uncultured Thiotrichaceae bacterium]
MKSTLTLVFFATTLAALPQTNADDLHLKIHIDSETDELLQTPSSHNIATKENTTRTTQRLLSIEASPVIGGGFIVTPNEVLLPHMSMHIGENGQMHTLCR